MSCAAQAFNVALMLAFPQPLRICRTCSLVYGASPTISGLQSLVDESEASASCLLSGFWGSAEDSGGTSNSGPSSLGRCWGAVFGKRTGPGWRGGATSWARSSMATDECRFDYFLLNQRKSLLLLSSTGPDSTREWGSVADPTQNL